MKGKKMVMNKRYKKLIREKWQMNVVSKHLIEETEL
jgi:hypothetical protein